jgi:photosystem II stability/assembly factor-like uncharacterized protein
LKYTTNGGKNWEFGFYDKTHLPVFNNNFIYINHLIWGKDNNIIAFADSGYYWKTKDLKNWEKKQFKFESIYIVQDVTYLDDLILVSFGDIVYFSENFGDTWDTLYNAKNEDNKIIISEMSIVDKNNLFFSYFDYIYDNNSTVMLLKFDLKEKKWTKISDFPVFPNIIKFYSDDNAFFYRSDFEGFNTVFNSKNGGNSWERILQLPFPEHNYMNNFTLLDSLNGYYSNQYQVMIRTNDGFKTHYFDSTYSNFSGMPMSTLSKVGENKWLVTNITGKIFKYTDEEDIGVSVEDTQENYNTHNSLIFPNPSSDKISIDLGGVAKADLVVYDILGNEIMSIPKYTNKSEIDISNLSIGTYTIQLQTSTGSMSQRLLVNR